MIVECENGKIYHYKKFGKYRLPINVEYVYKYSNFLQKWHLFLIFLNIFHTNKSNMENKFPTSQENTLKINF